MLLAFTDMLIVIYIYILHAYCFKSINLNCTFSVSICLADHLSDKRAAVTLAYWADIYIILCGFDTVNR